MTKGNVENMDCKKAGYSKSNLGGTQAGVLWKTCNSETSPAMFGTHWTAEAPVPMTATFLPFLVKNTIFHNYLFFIRNFFSVITVILCLYYIFSIVNTILSYSEDALPIIDIKNSLILNKKWFLTVPISTIFSS